jgi:hypothetical protein
VLAGCLGDRDPPELVTWTPIDGMDERGVGSFDVDVTYHDDSDVTVEVLADDVAIGSADGTCDDDPCEATVRVQTGDVPPGIRNLSIVLEDSAGNRTRDHHYVRFDDVLVIRAIEVTDVVDEDGTLEIEVYAFDADDQMIGCAGSRHGLSLVDIADQRYVTEAVAITRDGLAFGTLDANERPFRLEVWEDDDAPVCPATLDPAYNDFLGASPLMTVDDWRATGTVAFDHVPELKVAWERPLVENQDVDPPIDPPPSFGGAGCTATHGDASALLLLALLGLRRRRLNR